MKLTYSLAEDGMRYPDLVVDEESVRIGIWGKRRLRYLKEHRRSLYTTLMSTGRLNAHLAEIDRSAAERYEHLVVEMARTQGIGEQLKRSDQTIWVRLMSSVYASAREVVNTELVYS